MTGLVLALAVVLAAHPVACAIRARRSRLRGLEEPAIAGGGRAAIENGPALGCAGGGPSRVSVVIPALNEEESIGWVLERLPSWVSQVVLVDGLSSDRTEAVARTLCPDIVVVHQDQRGKGSALRAGFAAATGEIIVMIDADGSTDPGEMPRFVEALEAGADFVKGSRHLAGGGSVDFTRMRQGGNRAFVLLANLLYGQRFTDLCYGYCAFWRRHVDALALTADGFEIETQLVLNAVKAKLSIAEVPSMELARRAGSSNLNALTDGGRVLRTMLRERRIVLDRVGMRSAPIVLLEVQVAAHDSGAWRPAGQDRRRGERRRCGAGRILDGAPGPELRRADRRAQPAGASTIYRVLGQPGDHPELAFPDRRRLWVSWTQRRSAVGASAHTGSRDSSSPAVPFDGPALVSSTRLPVDERNGE